MLLLEYFLAGKFEDLAQRATPFSGHLPRQALRTSRPPCRSASASARAKLLRLMNADVEKYRRMHKGAHSASYRGSHSTCVELCEKAMFYMDTGIAEDVRKCQ